MSGKVIPFNPLDRIVLGSTVAEALIGAKPLSFKQNTPIVGAGVYAIYYHGQFEPYAKLANANRDGACAVPIYVGKAVPSGSRKGATVDSSATSTALAKRLKDHATSIAYADNLKIEDFLFRYLVVDEIWIPLGESMMISRYMPLWNTSIDGFGNHNPGKGRVDGMRPRWDVLHPGRPWAPKYKERLETQQEIADEVTSLLASVTFPNSDRIIGGEG